MNKELDEFIQKSIIGENLELSNVLQELFFVKEELFTNREIEAQKNYNFSLVVYKKENPIVKFFRKIKFSFEKIRIMKYSREAIYIKSEDKNFLK